jgi:hypothetical protein
MLLKCNSTVATPATGSAAKLIAILIAIGLELLGV